MVKDALKDMNLSDQEMQKFEKAFQDPEFIRMFSEYAKEMQDPANRAETDAYLRQLEEQGDIESTYGKGTQLIVPEPKFCFKTHAKPCGTKVFVNVCSSDKVKKPSMKPARDANGMVGQQWQLPLAGSNSKRVTTDKKGNTAWVWDVTLSTETFALLTKEPRLRNLIVQSAIEHIENTNQVKLERKYSCPKLRFKGTEENPDQPAVSGSRRVQAIRGDVAEAQDGMLKPQEAPERFQKAINQDAENESPGNSGTNRTAGEFKSKGGRSLFRFKDTKPEAPVRPTDAGYIHAGGEVTPVHSIVHQGHQDLADAWSDPTVHAKRIVPKALLVRVELPKVQSASDAALKVLATRISVKVPALYLLDIQLPFSIELSGGSAKFDASTKILELWLPVLDKQPGRSQENDAPVPESKKEASSGPSVCQHGPENLDRATKACASHCQPSTAHAEQETEKPDAAQPSSTEVEERTESQLPMTARGAADRNICADGVTASGGSSAAADAISDAITTHPEASESAVSSLNQGLETMRTSHKAVPNQACIEKPVPAKFEGVGTSSQVDRKATSLSDPVDLKELALQWDVLNHALDSEVSEAETKSCADLVSAASAVPGIQTDSSVAMPVMSGNAVSANPVVHALAPDCQLRLALNLPMLGELD